MNKWIYLTGSCIFLLLIAISYPIVKGHFSGSNMYLMLLFIACFIGLFYMFLKESLTSSAEQNQVMSQFTAAE